MTALRVGVIGGAVSRLSLERATGAADSDPTAFVDMTAKATATVVATAQTAWRQAHRRGDDVGGIECWLGTLYGTTHVHEYYVALLRDPKPLLNPRAFSVSCLNSVSSAVSSALGLGGASITIVGEHAGLDALANACRSLALGRSQYALCGAFDWPSEFAARVLAARGIHLSATLGGVAALVLTSDPARVETAAAHVTLTDAGELEASEQWSRSSSVLSPAVSPLIGLALTTEEAALSRGTSRVSHRGAREREGMVACRES